MKRYCFLLFLLSIIFSFCDQSPGTDASSIVPAINKNLQPNDDFKIYSEPKSSKITIEFKSKETGQAMLSVYYSDGKLFNRKTLYVNKGINTWDYLFPYKASGVFIIKILMKDVERTGKVFKASS